MQINVSVTDANNIVCEVVPPQPQIIVIDRGVEGNGIVSIVPVTISTFQYLRITYTNGTVQDVGPLTSTAYTATAPITIVGNTISLATVPIASGGTDATTAAGAIQNLLPSYTGNANKRLGLNSGGTALEWVLDGGGTVTSVAASGGTTGLTFTGSPITTSGTLTLGGTLAVASGGTGVTSSTGTGSVVLSTSPTLVTPLLGTPTSGNFSTGTFTWPTFNQNTTGTAANITATSNSTLTTLSSLSLPYVQLSGTVPTWNQNTTGTAANVTGVVAIANGGTGQITANAALNALLPTQTGNASKYLQTDGTNATWDAISLSTADITGILGVSNGGTGLSTLTAGYIPFGAGTSAFGSSSNLFWDNTNARLSVGTASPDSVITFAGNITSKGNDAYGIGTNGGNNHFNVFATGASGAVRFWTNGSSATAVGGGGSERARIDSAGNFGIGTSSPTKKLDIRGTNAGELALIQINNDSISGAPTIATMEFACLGSAKASIAAAVYADGYMAFRTNNNTEKARITASGELLIGRTSSSGLGQIQSTIGADLATDSGNVYLVRGGGNVGIGTSSPTDKLTLNSSGSGTGFKITGYQPENFINLNNTLSTGNRTFRLLSGITSVGYDGFSVFDTVANATRLVINNSGNLGIGTTSPSYKLDVNGDAKINNLLWFTPSSGGMALGANGTNFEIYNGAGTETRLTLNNSGNLGLGVTPSAWGSTYKVIQLPSSTYGGGSFITDAGSPAIAGNAYNNAGWKYVNNDFATIYQSRSGQHQWFTAASGTAGNAITFTQAMTLTAAGDLGVGTTTPDIFGRFYTRSVGISSSGTTSLQINGSTYGTIDLGAGGIRTTSITGSSSEAQIATVTAIPILFTTNSVERARITSSGDFGIGTTSTAGKLDVLGSSNRFIVNPYYFAVFSGGMSSYTKRLFGGAVVDDFAYIGDMYYENSGTWKTPQTSYAATTFGGGVTTFYGGTGVTANTAFYPIERARITSDGVFYMNRTTTNSYDTNIWLQCNISSWLIVNNHTFSTQYFNVFRYNGTSIGSIIGNGTSTTYATSSDYRLKENIAPMTGALAKVAQLKPCTYTWKSNGSSGEGFIAHELAEVMPQAVTGEKDAVDENGNPDYQGIDTSFLVATLTAAIQELKAEFDAYKASHP